MTDSIITGVVVSCNQIGARGTHVHRAYSTYLRLGIRRLVRTGRLKINRFLKGAGGTE